MPARKIWEQVLVMGLCGWHLRGCVRGVPVVLWEPPLCKHHYACGPGHAWLVPRPVPRIETHYFVLRFFPFLVNQVFSDKMAALLPQYLCYEPKPFVSANAVGSARLQF